jgi:hypothetical protein
MLDGETVRYDGKVFEDQRNQLLANLDEAHEAYYWAATFAGPSLYFHLRSLEAAYANDFEHVVEYLYALLTSWGMHRMGPGGSKMREFEGFKESLKRVWPITLELRHKMPSDLEEEDWSNLRKAFCELHCMDSGTSLVANSKVMAHLLPKLIPPVDRQYTLKFLFKHGRINNGIELEWRRLEEILIGFFYPIANSIVFQDRAAEWLTRTDQFKWDTSALKIVDNLVIGLSKIAHNEKEPSDAASRPTRA